MILSAQSIRQRAKLLDMIVPFNERTETVWGMSYGLGPASYDVCVAEDITLWPGEMTLVSTIERVKMQDDVGARVADKSSWARKGVTVQNTWIDPGFEGFVTLELCNHTQRPVTLSRGMPIAQFVFEKLDEPTDQPYRGKYQNQAAGAQPAREGNGVQRDRLVVADKMWGDDPNKCAVRLLSDAYSTQDA